MLLVYFDAGAAAITLMMSAGSTAPGGFCGGVGTLGGLGDWFAIGMVFAITIAAAIYSLGKISSVHLNPAVTIAFWTTGRIPWRDAIAYIVAQCLGAVAGSILFGFTAGPAAITIGGLGATAPFPGISTGQAILAEMIGTFILMLVIMRVVSDERTAPAYAGAMIGLTVGGVITATGNIAGASLNTARTFGPYFADWVFGGPNLWQFFPIYVIGPVAGAVIAALLYDLLAKSAREY
jgi:glycerol uptake facilitator protein